MATHVELLSITSDGVVDIAIDGVEYRYYGVESVSYWLHTNKGKREFRRLVKHMPGTLIARLKTETQYPVETLKGKETSIMSDKNKRSERQAQKWVHINKMVAALEPKLEAKGAKFLRFPKGGFPVKPAKHCKCKGLTGVIAYKWVKKTLHVAIVCFECGKWSEVRKFGPKDYNQGFKSELRAFTGVHLSSFK